MKKEILEQILSLKVNLLVNGFAITPENFERIKSKGFLKSLGRKGGAGPAGGRYFKFPNGSIVNTQIWIKEKKKKESGMGQSKKQSPQVFIEDIKEDFQVLYDLLFPEDFPMTKIDSSVERVEKLIGRTYLSSLHIPLYLVKVPRYYCSDSEDGITYKKIALMHGPETMATTIHQTCRYWRGGQECDFCAIEKSLQLGATIENKTGKQIVETIKEAKKEDPRFAKHITLTSGTYSNDGKGVKHYIDVVSIIKKEFPEIPIHIQIEPLKNKDWYNKLKKAGVDTIGIHLEILNEDIRKEICPGKSHLSKEVYFEHWKEAISIFGKSQVSTFIIIGYENNLDKFKKNLEKVLEAGVVPVLTPVRYIPDLEKATPKTSYREMLEITLFVAKLCLKYGINPTKNKAGCIRCGGCSALIDAYNLENLKKSEQ